VGRGEFAIYAVANRHHIYTGENADCRASSRRATHRLELVWAAVHNERSSNKKWRCKEVGRMGILFATHVESLGSYRAILVSSLCDRIASDGLSTTMASTLHPSQPIHPHDLPGRRAGNDRVAGPGVDWEVKRTWRLQECGMLTDEVRVRWGEPQRRERCGRQSRCCFSFQPCSRIHGAFWRRAIGSPSRHGIPKKCSPRIVQIVQVV
jgi:hypothetical protein